MDRERKEGMFGLNRDPVTTVCSGCPPGEFCSIWGKFPFVPNYWRGSGIISDCCRGGITQRCRTNANVGMRLLEASAVFVNLEGESESAATRAFRWVAETVGEGGFVQYQSWS